MKAMSKQNSMFRLRRTRRINQHHYRRLAERSLLNPDCGEYEISNSAADTAIFQRLGREQRRNALKRARQAAKWGKRPRLTTYAT